MLTILRDNVGVIQVACEWYCVDERGQWQPRGQYILVNVLESSPQRMGVGLLRDLIRQIAWECPWAVGAYWRREVHTGTRAHGFRRTQLVKEVRG